MYRPTRHVRGSVCFCVAKRTPGLEHQAHMPHHHTRAWAHHHCTPLQWQRNTSIPVTAVTAAISGHKTGMSVVYQHVCANQDVAPITAPPHDTVAQPRWLHQYGGSDNGGSPAPCATRRGTPRNVLIHHVAARPGHTSERPAAPMTHPRRPTYAQRGARICGLACGSLCTRRPGLPAGPSSPCPQKWRGVA